MDEKIRWLMTVEQIAQAQDISTNLFNRLNPAADQIDQSGGTRHERLDRNVQREKETV